MSTQDFVRAARQSDAADVARIQVDCWRHGYPGLIPDAVLAELTSDDALEPVAGALGGSDRQAADQQAPGAGRHAILDKPADPTEPRSCTRPFTMKDRLEHARWEAQQASDRLSEDLGTQVYVRPVLAVYGPKVPWLVATIREVDVFNGDRLRKYLRRNATMKDRPKLSAGEIEQIYAAAARVLPLNNGAKRTPVG